MQVLLCDAVLTGIYSTNQVLLRAYVRIFMVKTVAADDWWMFASMVRRATSLGSTSLEN